MSTAIPVSFSLPYQKARATDATDTSFASKVPTTTEPTSDGVVELAKTSLAPTWLMLIPYATAGDNDTADVRVIGWRRVTASAVTLWVPTILLQFSATFSTAVGVAGSPVLATQRFADTLSDPATGMGAIGVNCQPSSPANNTPGHYLFDARGCQKVEVLLDATAAGTTGMNALIAQV